MIALYIFLGILALLLLLLVSPFHVTFTYDRKARVRLRTLCFSLDGGKLFQKIAASSQKKGEKASDRSAKPKTEEKRSKKKASPLGFVEFLAHITRVLARAVRDLFAVTHIHLKKLCVVFSASDAAATALCYGAAVQAGYALIAVLQRFSHLRTDSENLVLAPDFTGENTRFAIDLDVSIRPILLIPLFFRTYFALVKGKDERNERNPVEASH